MTAMSKTQPTVLAEIQTYDAHDCTSIGYDVQVRDDGTLKLTKRSRWQGSLDGQVYITTTPLEIARAVTDMDDDEPDLETAVREWLQQADPSEWKMIRSGHKVQ